MERTACPNMTIVQSIARPPGLSPGVPQAATVTGIEARNLTSPRTGHILGKIAFPTRRVSVCRTGERQAAEDDQSEGQRKT